VEPPPITNSPRMFARLPTVIAMIPPTPVSPAPPPCDDEINAPADADVEQNASNPTFTADPHNTMRTSGTRAPLGSAFIVITPPPSSRTVVWRWNRAPPCIFTSPVVETVTGPADWLFTAFTSSAETNDPVSIKNAPPKPPAPSDDPSMVNEIPGPGTGVGF